jgi:hypothetical protein
MKAELHRVSDGTRIHVPGPDKLYYCLVDGVLVTTREYFAAIGEAEVLKARQAIAGYASAPHDDYVPMAEPGWHAVDDIEKPDQGDRVLVYDAHTNRYAVAIYCVAGAAEWATKLRQVTHWMPIPKVPA